MIPRSRSLAALVLVASAGSHLAAMGLIWRAPEVQMEGGAEMAVASLGSSFADMAAGTQAPEVPTTAETHKTTPTVTPAAAPPVTATPVVQPTPQVAPETTRAAPPPETTAPAPTETPVVPMATLTPSETPPAETPPVQTARLAETPPPPERIEALPEAPPLAESLRPKARPKPPAPAPAPGNADRNARIGTDTGRAEVKSKAAQSERAGTTTAAGNAAADNYPGQVMRRISRVPRPRVATRGATVVAFSIAANGALASASVARSSGSTELDTAALAVLRKAAPFPAPPAGARRQFSIRIEGR
ncbi:TonB family protein [Seohaeicola nanhaiensis]|uniref:TonB family protein n=1 Tax=Seohaeicola nanhaiensis TaxID=1387282 RepID=A0ABV9KNI3_9RHOB